MGKIINIDNSKLRIREIASFTEFEDAIKRKTGLYYFSETNSKFITVEEGNLSFMETPLRENSKAFWLIEETEEENSINNYDYGQTGILMSIYFSLINTPAKIETHKKVYTYLYVLERLVRATKSEDLIISFYKNVSKKKAGWGNTDNIQILNDFLKIEDSRLFSATAMNLPRYHFYSEKTKYDVLDLIDDLTMNKVYINLDPDRVTEKYYSMSSGVKYDLFNNKGIHIEEWGQVTSKIGNSNRANISLSYKTKIDVEIPENDLVEEKVITADTIRNVCIIKDGFLWTKQIVVKLSPELHKKLEENGVVMYEGIDGDGDYVIDLTSVPVIKRSRLEKFDKNRFVESFYQTKLYECIIHYIRLKQPQKSPEKTLVGREKFLSELGIVDGFYTRPEIQVPSTKKKKVDDRTEEDIPGIQFRATLTIQKENRLVSNPSIYALADLALEDSGKGWTNPLLRSIFAPIDEFLEKTSPEELISEYLGKLEYSKNQNRNWKIVIYYLRNTDIFCSNSSDTSIVHKVGVGKDLEGLGATISTKLFNIKIPSVSYNW